MSHKEIAKKFLSKPDYAKWHDKALWFVRAKRDIASKEVKEWETLRENASIIKEHTLKNLGYYLQEFEKNAKKNGIKIHYAKDANEHNKIVYNILKSHNISKVVKSKSMLTEECGLNPYLEKMGIEITDTDLGERIVQLGNEPPSHIVLPAIHLKKEQIGVLFEQKLGSQKGNFDPTYLTNVAREDLRKKFLNAGGAISGVNFAIAQTGGVVVCTNEGNADLGTSLASVHIACMGVEKLIPKLSHLGVFTRLLARSATGQAITTYTTHFSTPASGKELHIVIVDNARSKILKEQKHKEALKCIRCGACMNTCPVYRRSGGHSYGYTIPGPIGSVLANAKEPKKHASLAYASTLCGSCSNVCPVKINLHKQLLSFRGDYIKNYAPLKKRVPYILGSVLLKNNFVQTITLRTFAKSYNLLKKYNLWGKGRDLPKPAPKSFKQIYKEKYAKK